MWVNIIFFIVFSVFYSITFIFVFDRTWENSIFKTIRDKFKADSYFWYFFSHINISYRNKNKGNLPDTTKSKFLFSRSILVSFTDMFHFSQLLTLSTIDLYFIYTTYNNNYVPYFVISKVIFGVIFEFFKRNYINKIYLRLIIFKNNK